MKTSITLTLRAFPVIVENTETQEVKKDIIVLTKEHLRAAQLVGQSSKEVITRICANEGYRVVEIGKPAKRDVTFNLPLLCGLADGFDITADFKEILEMYGVTVKPESCFILYAAGQRIRIEEFDEDGGGLILDVSESGSSHAE